MITVSSLSCYAILSLTKSKMTFVNDILIGELVVLNICTCIYFNGIFPAVLKLASKVLQINIGRLLEVYI